MKSIQLAHEYFTLFLYPLTYLVTAIMFFRAALRPYKRQAFILLSVVSILSFLASSIYFVFSFQLKKLLPLFPANLVDIIWFFKIFFEISSIFIYILAVWILTEKT
jgi:hypothetical protein